MTVSSRGVLLDPTHERALAIRERLARPTRRPWSWRRIAGAKTPG